MVKTWGTVLAEKGADWNVTTADKTALTNLTTAADEDRPGISHRFYILSYSPFSIPLWLLSSPPL
ncbi:MAG: hypothetical protein LBN21_08390 [Treponema sp.]|jgi:hypothetical protein|nr:hypothetical protein [Treponema sp.]